VDPPSVTKKNRGRETKQGYYLKTNGEKVNWTGKGGMALGERNKWKKKGKGEGEV